MALNTVEEIIQDIRQGKMVVLMDDEDRENEGDIVMAAECVTAEHINFMAKHARGLICMPMTRERCERLKLPLMVERNVSGFGTKFTVSIEAASGVTTGISAADRARTVRVAAARNVQADEIVQPGHIFPLMCDAGGVLVRAGHTEAACDLARLAGFEATGVICEVMNDDGSMARRPDLEKFAAAHGLKIGTIADLIHYRVLYESTVEKISVAPVVTEYGDFVLHTYRDRLNNDVHFAMVKGDITPDKPVLARVQLTVAIRDLLGVCVPGRSSWSVGSCLKRIVAEGSGVLIMLGGHETPDDLLASVDIVLGKRAIPEATPVGDKRAYLTVGVGSQILRDIGARHLRLMGAPIKYNALSGFDLDVVEYVSAE
jgi:3,4-dihydroxy 2-butanone 4-phosphate synthase/GTP cyclohydrolase II